MRRLVMAALLALVPAAAMGRDDPKPMVGACNLRDPQMQRQCEYYRVEFQKQYPRAVRGDYQAQRNVAYMMSGAIRPLDVNPVRVDVNRACAWRMVILASGHAEADESDRGNFVFDCRRPGVVLEWATMLGQAIMVEAAVARELDPPAAQPTPPPSGRPLDSTAQPLRR